MAEKTKEKVEEVEAKVKDAPTASAAPAGNNADGYALGSLIIGILNLCSWCLPLCGCPLSIIGIVLGVMGMKSEEKKTMATIGLILSVIGLIATLANTFLGFAFSFSDLQTY